MPSPRRIALATRAGISPLGAQELKLVVEALAREGVEAEPKVWTEPWDPAGYDAVVIRSTWDYPERIAEFLEWTRRVEATTPLWNGASLVAWNLHKGYLLDLAAKGAPLPPTRLVRRGERADLGALMAAAGWGSAVVKPAIGVTSIGSRLVDGQTPAAGQAHLDGLLAKGDALVQEYLPTIVSAGEVSIFAFGGELAHAVRKVPKAGDYRVQNEYGGTQSSVRPTAAQLDVARRVLAAAPSEVLYARVDLVTLPDGSAALMELEAIEPYLYLDGLDQAGPYARAIAAVL